VGTYSKKDLKMKINELIPVLHNFAIRRIRFAIRTRGRGIHNAPRHFLITFMAAVAASEQLNPQYWIESGKVLVANGSVYWMSRDQSVGSW